MIKRIIKATESENFAVGVAQHGSIILLFLNLNNVLSARPALSARQKIERITSKLHIAPLNAGELAPPRLGPLSDVCVAKNSWLTRRKVGRHVFGIRYFVLGDAMDLVGNKGLDSFRYLNEYAPIVTSLILGKVAHQTTGRVGFVARSAWANIKQRKGENTTSLSTLTGNGVNYTESLPKTS